MLTEERLALRRQNNSFVRPDSSELAKLDGSIKKNTSFVKKLKQFSADQLESLKKEFLSLKMEKYLAEVVGALSSCRFKNAADADAAVYLTSLIHQRYSGFLKPLVEAVVKQVGPPPPSYGSIDAKEKEEPGRVAKQRSSLRYILEMYLVGLIPDQPKNPLLVRLFYDMFGSDNEFLNISIAVTVLKNFAMDIFPSKEPKEELLVTPEIAQSCEKIFHDYFKQVCDAIVKEHRRLKQMEATNFEYSISKGELSDERKEKYDYTAKSFERLHSGAQSMSEVLGLALPELKEEEKTTRIGMVISAQGGEEDTEEDFGYWDDEEEKAFYEDIMDLKNLVPGVLLGEAVDEKTEEKKEELDGPEISMEEVPEEEDSEEEEKTVSTGAQADLDNLITRLNEAMNRESIDKLAVEFCYLNSKAARGKLVKALLSVSRMRLDLLPYFSRFVAILKPYMPDVSSVLVETLLKKFWDLWKNFRPDLGYVEDRVKNIRFIGELVKFRVAPYYAAFRTLNCLVEDFTGYHIDVACNLLDTCGKFLFRNPVTHSRFVNVLDIIMRKKAAQRLDQRHVLMIENAYYQCNPPERSALVKKEREPIEQYLRKLIYVDLERQTVEHVLRQLRKFDWYNPSIVSYMEKIFFKIWKVKFSNLQYMAFMLYELSKYYPNFGIKVVDNVLEEIKSGLESNLFKHNQKRLSVVAFLAELYNYRMLDHPIIFQTLYFILKFGHDNGIPSPTIACPLDMPYDFFRIRLVCTLLSVCGEFFHKGRSGKKLDEFLVFFQLYIFSKQTPTMDIEYIILELFERLRPHMKFFESYEEAAIEVNKIAVKYQGAAVEEEEEEEERALDPLDSDPEPESEEQAEEEVIVHMPTEQVDEEADAEFEREFAKMMQESLDSRRHERKVAALNVAMPTKRGFGLGDSGQELVETGGHVEFTILTKKGNKPHSKTMALPSDISFVQSTKSQREAELEEKRRLKEMVLNYERQEHEEPVVEKPMSQKERKMMNRGRGRRAYY